MLTVRLDTSPLENGHSGRGVGTYTRLLLEALKAEKEITVLVDTNNSQPDVVHYPFFDLFQNTLPWRKKAPTIVTIHDVIPLMFPEFYQPGLKGKIRHLQQRAALQNVQMIITDSVFSQQHIHRLLHISLDKIKVIYLAAHPELKKPVVDTVQSQLQELKLPKEYILYVGDINYNKNIPQLIKSLKFLPENIHLVCVGHNFRPQPIPEWKWIETQLALSDVRNRVHFVTTIASNQLEVLAAVYTGAVAYVQPSLAEGFGLPVLEAMQCETPVVSSKASSLAEVAGPFAILTEPIAEELAAGVKTVLGWTEAERAEWIHAALKHAQTFTWAKTAKQLVAVYQQVAHEK